VLFAPLTQLSYIPVSVGLGHDLGLSAGQIGITIGAHSLATAVASLTIGPLLDLVPVRRVLVPAMVLNVVMASLLCLQPGFELLTIGRVVTGVASGAVSLCGYALVTDLTRGDPGARDRGFSLLQTFVSIGAGSALGIGALAAANERPTIVFGAAAVYAAVLLVIVLVTGGGRTQVGDPHADVSETFRVRVSGVLRGVAMMVTERRMQWLMVSAVVIGLVMQGGHYGVSVLLDSQSQSIATWQRVGLSVLIPCGVFTGSFINRWALRRAPREQIFAALYLVLPAAVLVYGATVALELPRWAVAVGLLLLGTCIGAMMPLSVAISVGWFPELRGSSTAAESLARSAGQTAGPIIVGLVVAASSVSYSAVAIAVAAVVGLVASRMMLAGRAAPVA